ncbi:hypothetical protein ACERNI_06500 [Camelimonas sp. ID_303_24]
MTANEEIVRSFISAWSRLDAGEIVVYFTQGGVCHNVMNKPVSGHNNLRGLYTGLSRTGPGLRGRR